MKRIGTTAFLLAALLSAAWALRGHHGPWHPAPGQCPFVDKTGILCDTNARDTCRSDRSCPKGQRCCDTGCSRNCSPVCQPACGRGIKCIKNTIRYCIRAPCPQPPPVCERPKPSRLGTCPVNDILPFISCPVGAKDNCSRDNKCPKKQKCCSYGCSRTCVPPCLPGCRPDQKCVLLRPPVGPCLGSDCPPQSPQVSTCEPKDPCSVVDCKSGSRCVVRDGKAKCVPLSPRPGFCPANDVITTCEIRKNSCTSDTQCKRGQKCCSRGCGRECLPACRNCRPGQTCRITVFPCLIPPCPKGARCVTDKPVTKPGVCPRNFVISCLISRDTCRSDTKCNGDQKCCSYGCGRNCVSVCKKPCPPGQECRLTVTAPCFAPTCPEAPGCHPVKSVVRPGACPRYKYAGICVIGKNSCTSDKQCKRGQKCCRRGCGRECVSAIFVKKH